MSDPQGYYKTLGLEQNATQRDITKAYRNLATKFHPDKVSTGDEEEFKKIAKAYEILSNKESREKYDSKVGIAFTNFFGNGTFPDASTFFASGGGFDTGRRVLETLVQMRNFSGNTASGNTCSSSSSSSYSDGSSFNKQQKAPRIENVYLTLEEICSGCDKKVSLKNVEFHWITRNRLMDHSFELSIKPGWKEGTRMTFDTKTDYVFNKAKLYLSVPIQFVIKYHKHDIYDTVTLAKDNTLRIFMDIDIKLAAQKEINISFKDLRDIQITKKIAGPLCGKQVVVFPGCGMYNRRTGTLGDVCVTTNITANNLTASELLSVESIL